MSLPTAVPAHTVSKGQGSTVGTADGRAAKPAAFAAVLQASVAAQNGDPVTGDSAHAAPVGDATVEGPTGALPSNPAWGNWGTAAAGAGELLVTEPAPGTGSDGQPDEATDTGTGNDGAPVPGDGTEEGTDSGAETTPSAPAMQLPVVAIVPVASEAAVPAPGIGMPAAPPAADTATATESTGGQLPTTPPVDGDTDPLHPSQHPAKPAGESPAARAGTAGTAERPRPVLPVFTSVAAAPAADATPTAAPAHPVPAATVSGSTTVAPGNQPPSPAGAQPERPVGPNVESSARPPAVAPGPTTHAIPSSSGAGGARATSIPAEAASASRQPDAPMPVAQALVAPPVTPLGGLTPVTAAPVTSAAPAPLAAQVSPTLFTLVGAKAGEHVLTINVAPDNLGPVTVRAHVTVDSVRMELYAPTDAGRDALRAILPELRKDLAGSGLNANLDLSSENHAPGQDPQRQRTPDARPRHTGPDSLTAADSGPRTHRASSASTIDVLA